MSTLYIGDDPRAPHIQERREFWVLKSSSGKVTEYINDHVKIFGTGSVQSMSEFSGIMAAISAQCRP